MCIRDSPTLVVMADFMGVVGGYVYSVFVLNIDMHHYRVNSAQYVAAWDLFYGLFKSLLFGATIALVRCHRGFHCSPGAEGVGRAATAAFVHSFVLILVIDLMLGIVLDKLYMTLWPSGAKLM